MALDAWDINIVSINKLFDNLTNEELLQEVSPNRNRGVYILGHLAAVHDRMLPLLDFGHQLYPFLNDVYLEHPDKSGLPTPTTDELREYWKTVNEKLHQHFNQLEPAEWFGRHTFISEDDFVKEPQRNKLNVVLNRTNHLASHRGQLVFLRK